jgi:gliding motility-associated-like protein
MSLIMLQKFLVIFSLLFYQPVFAQNLVPNGGFEILNDCPENLSYLHFADGWYYPYSWPGSTLNNSCSTDLFSSCSNSSFIWSDGINICSDFGCSDPAEGENFAGQGFISSSFWKEMMQIRLSKEMTPNQWYKISVQVKLANDPYNGLNNLGAEVLEFSFTKDTTLMINVGNASNFPRHIFPCGIISDQYNWTKVEALYLASGGEEFLTLGYFGDTTDIHIQNNLSPIEYMFASHNTYYFIDDIQVLPYDHVPNIFTPNGDGINDEWYVPTAKSTEQFFIYNRWGINVKTLDSNEKWDGKDASGKDCTVGYYYFLSSSKAYQGVIYKI